MEGTFERREASTRKNVTLCRGLVSSTQRNPLEVLHNNLFFAEPLGYLHLLCTRFRCEYPSFVCVVVVLQQPRLKPQRSRINKPETSGAHQYYGDHG